MGIRCAGRTDRPDVDRTGGATVSLVSIPSRGAAGASILGGTLQLGNGGASGSIVGIVVDSSVFAIVRSDTYIFSGTITGSGSFAQIGTGTTILTGANTYVPGGTTISAKTGDQQQSS